MNIFKSSLVQKIKRKLSSIKKTEIWDETTLKDRQLADVVKTIRKDVNQENLDKTFDELMHYISSLGRINNFENIFSQYQEDFAYTQDKTQKYSKSQDFISVLKKAFSFESKNKKISGMARNQAQYKAIQTFNEQTKDSTDPRTVILRNVIDMIAAMQAMHGSLNNIEDLLSSKPKRNEYEKKERHELSKPQFAFQLEIAIADLERITDNLSKQKLIPPPRPRISEDNPSSKSKKRPQFINFLFKKKSILGSISEKTKKLIFVPCESFSEYKSNFLQQLDKNASSQVQLAELEQDKTLNIKLLSRKENEKNIITAMKDSISKLDPEKADEFNFEVYKIITKAIYDCKDYDEANDLSPNKFRMDLYDQLSILNATSNHIYSKKHEEHIQQVVKDHRNKKSHLKESLVKEAQPLIALYHDSIFVEVRNFLKEIEMNFNEQELSETYGDYKQMFQQLDKLHSEVDLAINSGATIKNMQDLMDKVIETDIEKIYKELQEIHKNQFGTNYKI